MSTYLRLRNSTMIDDQGLGLEDYDCCMIMSDPTKKAGERKVGKYQSCRARPSTNSPVLLPCEFWLFPRLKKPLSGRKFECRADIGSVIF